jgi:hypothetical protein
MNKNTTQCLKLARKIYMKAFLPRKDLYGSHPVVRNQHANKLIAEAINGPKPVMVARLGAVEASCIGIYKSIHNTGNRPLNYIRGRAEAFWWEENSMSLMANNAGFFPAEPAMLERFSSLMLEDMAQVDILGSWLWQEKLFSEELKNATRIGLTDLEPYNHDDPWSLSLEGKRVLVIHPFTKSISEQYSKRHLIFKDSPILPEFDLVTLKAVQSIANTHTGYKNWFDALTHMKDQISSIDFDVAIIGCGAYGFPLAAHVKRLGKKGIHLGGATQTLFGIKGKRWETKKIHGRVADMMNEHWVRPQVSETPQGIKSIEDGCYW